MLNTASESVTKEIIRASDAIRRKFVAMKRGREENEQLLQETFKPIIAPLREIVKTSHLKRILPQSKQMVLNQPPPPPMTPETPHTAFKPKIPRRLNFDNSNESMADAKIARRLSTDLFLPTETIAESGPDADPEEVAQHSVESSEEIERLKELFGDIAGEYLADYIENSSERDDQFGVRRSPNTGEFTIGNSIVTINHNDLNIDDEWYTGTPGLYELLFKRRPNPKKYTENDKSVYLGIVLKTNAHKIMFSTLGRVAKSRLWKYQNIIKDIVPMDATPKRKGYGFMRATDSKPEYIFWNDPNELVERLRLLLASREAGNNSHENEVISIIEELQEEGIIE